ncbi:hypothetical protein VTK56DRAFT_2867 [Thermocarpiscus australiensis]
METSSPVAAVMRPPPASPFSRGNLFGPHLMPGAVSPLRAGQFGFQRSGEGPLFDLKAIRGSSPSASLAADLSQNFKLNDNSSPMFPTPRRALFTTTTMMDSTGGAREYVTTPPLPPSSSPIQVDMMDMSPLPRKVPFVAHEEIPSPTPGTEEITFDSTPPRSSFLEPSKPVAADRRKLGLRRPSLSRTKCSSSSTSSHVTRSQSENQPPPSRPGNGGICQLCASPCSCMSLSECFEDSPPLQERRNYNPDSPCSPLAISRTKQHFNSLNSVNCVRNGSPITNHARKTTNPFLRRGKQYRRSLSMFENPDDVLKLKKEEPAFPPPALHSVMGLEESDELILPHFFCENQDDTIPRISRGTMVEVLDGKYDEHFAHKIIIDCRFSYEYDGGHIDGAINYTDKKLLAAHLFGAPVPGRTLLIFHCEYSAHRAPIMARHIRAEDRNLNAENYPRLTYPDVYILEGGYCAFFTEHRERCFPQGYVEMNDALHVNTCEREMGRLRQNHRKGLGRAQTFAAFGQRDLHSTWGL